MALTNIAVQGAKPRDKAYRLKDERGLYLEVSPAGGKWWRLRYWFKGKENRLSLGTFPDVSLKDARERRDEARRLLARGQDPGQARKVEKAAVVEQAQTFEAVAREWISRNEAAWAPRHTESVFRRLEIHVLPHLGRMPIREISSPELLVVLRQVEAKGLNDTAHRALQVCGQVFRYAVACGLAERDPSGDLRGALPPLKVRHYPSITEPKEVAGLLRAIDGFQGHFVTRSALRLAPLVFVRPGELRQAEWPEFDLDGAEWRIPAARMKMKEQHIVPLARQAVAILRELHPLTGSGLLVFPSLRSAKRSMSENTVNAALRRLGYSREEMTGHGFRSMASTILNEQGWNRDAIERQLAHAERDEVRASYNYAEYLPERRRMMQVWADYLDAIKAGAKVIPMHRAEG